MGALFIGYGRPMAKTRRLLPLRLRVPRGSCDACPAKLHYQQSWPENTPRRRCAGQQNGAHPGAGVEECLNSHWFRTMNDLQTLDSWRQEYNCERSHSPPAYRTPAEFSGDLGYGDVGSSG